MIEIREGDRRAAFEVPFAVYGNDSPYVSPMWSDLDRMLDPARNPLERDGHGTFRLFTAHRNGRPVGRIVASVHAASNTRYGTRRGGFGFLDCGDDAEVASALLGQAEEWAGARGCDEIVGNFNLTAMQQVGVMTEGFEHAPYTDMLWSPPHLPALLEANGYTRTFPMSTFEIPVGAVPGGNLLGPKQRELLDDPSYRWMPITRRTFKDRLEDARRILNDGFDQNPMFVPPTREEFWFQAGEMMWILDPRLSVVVHHEGRPVGAVICIPDLNPMVRDMGSRYGMTAPWHFLKHRMRRERAVIVYYAVAREYHSRGLNGAMLHHLLHALVSGGYRMVGGTWIADVNGASLRQVEKVGAQRVHRLHLFRKTLGERP